MPRKKPGELRERFLGYYNTQWGDDEAYGISDFAKLFSIDNRLARYHLMHMVDEGKLIQIKKNGSTRYMKPQWAEKFKEFRWIGVRVIGDTGVRHKEVRGYVEDQRDGSEGSQSQSGSVGQTGQREDAAR